MLPTSQRLRHSADIQTVRQAGKRWHNPLVTLYVLANHQDVCRFAFVASRRVGKAVQRNRTKRLLREATRHYLPHLTPGWDCIFVARDKAAQASYQELLAAAYQLFNQAHLLQPTAQKGVSGP